MNNDCVQSLNYPSVHGNDEQCTVNILRDTALTVNDEFELETCCDHLMIRGEDVELSSSVPLTLEAGETIGWSTDSSVTRTGWQIFASLKNLKKHEFDFLKA